MQRLSAILVALAAASAIGCQPEGELHKSAASTCPDARCSKSLDIVINNECLDEMWQDGKWVDDVPQEVIGNCEPMLGSCTIPDVWGGTFQTPDCDCVEVIESFKGKDGFLEALVVIEERMCDELEGCCSATASDLPPEDQDAADDAAQEVVDALLDFGCGVNERVQCSPDEPWSCDMQIPCDGARLAALGVRAGPACASVPECSGERVLSAAAADGGMIFGVSAQRSYVRISGPFPTVTVPLSGSLRVARAPLRFVSAEVSAADASLAGLALSGWVFGLAQPIPFAGSQTFAIPPSAAREIVGSGSVDGETVAAALDRSATAFGSFDAAAGRWSLDYTESTLGATVRVHLEGSVAAAR